MENTTDRKDEDDSTESQEKESLFKDTIPQSKITHVPVILQSTGFVPNSMNFPKFTGAVHEDITSWINMIAQFGKLNNWTDQQLCAVVLTNVSMNIYKFLSVQDLDFHELSKSLIAHYGSTGLTQANKIDKITNRTQGPVESCADYGTSIWTLGKQMELEEEVIIGFFINGLRPNIKAALSTKEYSSFNDALKAAKQMELKLTVQQTGIVNTLNKDQTVEELSNKLDIVTTQLKNLTKKMKEQKKDNTKQSKPFNKSNRNQNSQQSKTFNKKSNVKCYFCGRQGHIEKDCYQKQRWLEHNKDKSDKQKDWSKKKSNQNQHYNQSNQ